MNSIWGGWDKRIFSWRQVQCNKLIIIKKVKFNILKNTNVNNKKNKILFCLIVFLNFINNLTNNMINLHSIKILINNNNVFFNNIFKKINNQRKIKKHTKILNIKK